MDKCPKEFEDVPLGAGKLSWAWVITRLIHVRGYDVYHDSVWRGLSKKHKYKGFAVWSVALGNCHGH